MAKTKIRFEDLEQGLTSPIALTSNAVNSVSIDGTTFSVDSLNNRVGIGTASPDAPLQIVNINNLPSTAPSTALLQTLLNNASGGNGVHLRTFARRWANGNDWNATNIRIQKRVDTTDQAFIDFGIDGVSQSDGLGFGSNSTTHMVMLANGNIGIGTTAPSQKLHVIGNILASGTITPSDKRLKSNVKDIDNISDKFDKLRPVSYDKKHGLDSEKSNFEYGFIADEFMELFPELVQEDGEDKIKSINYTSIIALLVKEMKELRAEIQTLKNKY